MERGEISIAELLRSLAHLKPGDAEAVETLCRVLQFEFNRAPVPPPVLPVTRPAAPPSRQRQEPPHPALGKELTRFRRVQDLEDVPFPWGNVEALPAQPEVSQRQAIEPLIPPLSRAAILSTAVATRNEGREVDIEKAVEAMASGKVLPRLPRLVVPSLRGGVQVLADVGEGMLPYASDRSEMIAAIQRIVGREQSTVMMFAGTPLRKAGPGPRHQWRQWSPPPRGTPVVLLTELGIGGPLLSRDRAPLGEWLKFCEELRRAMCSVVAFVPYEPRRWPAQLARAMTIVPWDRETTVSTVRHAVSPGGTKGP